LGHFFRLGPVNMDCTYIRRRACKHYYFLIDPLIANRSHPNSITLINSYSLKLYHFMKRTYYKRFEYFYIRKLKNNDICGHEIFTTFMWTVE